MNIVTFNGVTYNLDNRYRKLAYQNAKRAAAIVANPPAIMPDNRSQAAFIQSALAEEASKPANLIARAQEALAAYKASPSVETARLIGSRGYIAATPHRRGSQFEYGLPADVKASNAAVLPYLADAQKRFPDVFKNEFGIADALFWAAAAAVGATALMQVGGALMGSGAVAGDTAALGVGGVESAPVIIEAAPGALVESATAGLSESIVAGIPGAEALTLGETLAGQSVLANEVALVGFGGVDVTAALAAVAPDVVLNSAAPVAVEAVQAVAPSTLESGLGALESGAVKAGETVIAGVETVGKVGASALKVASVGLGIKSALTPKKKSPPPKRYTQNGAGNNENGGIGLAEILTVVGVGILAFIG